ncbi:MAG TPA: two-component regulator propeller domain-containing protein, partial [Chitinophagaceae bacterium]|nr:two-component regulator propeller domain-containing protein [Chitinophagaceae bacterium]
MTVALAAQPLRRLNSVSYNVNEGLLQSHVADMTEDGNGFMWVSTGSGVQRFDGKRFHQVMTGNGSRSLPEDKYVHFFRLANGNLWVTHHKGINEYDIHTNSFRKIYAFKNPTPANADENLLYGVQETPDAVWCVTPRGLVAISKQTQQVTGTILFDSLDTPPLLPPLAPTRNFFFAAGNNVCVFLAPAEIRIINTVTGKMTRVKASPEQSYFHAIEKLNDDSLLAASSRGIEKMSIQTGQFSLLSPYIVPPENMQQRFPVHLHLLQKDILVISVSGDLYEIALAGGKYLSHLVNPQNQSFLNNGYITSCLSDRFRNLWLVTVSDGIKKLNYNFSGFRYFGTPVQKNNFVKAVYVDKSANLVFSGTFNNGLYIFDTSQQLLRHIDQFAGAPPPYTVSGIDKAGPGEYLVYLSGAMDVYLLNTRSYTLRKLPVSIDHTGPVAKLDFYLSLLKKGDTASYISTIESLYRVKLTNGSLQLTLADSTPSGAICAYVDRKQRTWIGSAGNYYLCEGNGRPPLVFNLPGQLLCRCFWNDRSGKMWMGTEKGLYQLSREGKVLSVLHVSEGLPDDCIYAIREDRKGNLWLSHNKGITCMGRSGSMLHFSKNDGLQENEFNTNTSFETADGELYFGGVNGISS